MNVDFRGRLVYIIDRPEHKATLCETKHMFVFERKGERMFMSVPTQHGLLSVTEEVAQKAFEFFSRQALEGQRTFRMAAPRIAKLADISPATFYKVLHIFEAHNLITVDRGEGSKANTYTWLGGVAEVNTLLIRADADKGELRRLIDVLNERLERSNEINHQLSHQIQHLTRICSLHNIPTQTLAEMATFQAQK